MHYNTECNKRMIQNDGDVVVIRRLVDIEVPRVVVPIKESTPHHARKRRGFTGYNQ